jgi:hypothetical protein
VTALPAVKQDPVTGSVAVQLPQPNLFNADWAVMTTTNGGSFVKDVQVETWTDMTPVEEAE